MDGRNILKKPGCLLHRHIQHVIDTLSLVFYLQGLPVVALPSADLTGHIHIRQKMHLYLNNPVSAAGLAPSPLHVKAETALAVAFGLGIGRGGKQIPDHVKHACVGSRIRAGSAADRRLINGNHLV